jgi:hypothetical protein
LKYVTEQKSHTAIVGDLAVTVYGLKIGDRLRVDSDASIATLYDTIPSPEFGL